MSNQFNRREFVSAAVTAAVGLHAAPFLYGSAASSAGVPTGQSRPYPGGDEPDIWVFSGQSNSFGAGLMKAPVEPDPRILFLDYQDEWVVAQEPLWPKMYTWTPPPLEK